MYTDDSVFPVAGWSNWLFIIKSLETFPLALQLFMGDITHSSLTHVRYLCQIASKSAPFFSLGTVSLGEATRALLRSETYGRLAVTGEEVNQVAPSGSHNTSDADAVSSVLASRTILRDECFQQSCPPKALACFWVIDLLLFCQLGCCLTWGQCLTSQPLEGRCSLWFLSPPPCGSTWMPTVCRRL